MRTFDELVPAWDQTLSSTGGCTSQRFQCVMSSQAVLDRETGVVWQRTPRTVLFTPWNTSVEECALATTGGRKGWRAPTLSEAESLLDPAITGANQLFAGNPFIVDPALVGTFFATSRSRTDTLGKLFRLDGQAAAIVKTDTTFNFGIWCVRGTDGENGG
jgi:hypothetical protein